MANRKRQRKPRNIDSNNVDIFYAWNQTATDREPRTREEGEEN